MSSSIPKPRSLADAVEKVARTTAGKDWGLYANLLEHWAEIVGAEYARVTTPVKISFPYQPGEAHRKNGVLTIRLPKGLAMEFSFKSDLIRQRINVYFGYEAFARIALDPASVATPIVRTRRLLAAEDRQAIEEKVTIIENNELRDALKSFGESVYTSIPRR